MVNKVMILGRLGDKPELKYSASGTAYCELRLALNSKKKKGNDFIDHVDWVTVKVFGSSAENCVKFLGKGSQAFVEGRLANNNYTNKEGTKIYALDIIADRVQFVGATGVSLEPSAQPKAVYQEKKKVINERFSTEFDDIDIPF